SDTPFTQTIDKVQLPAEQIEHITDGLVNSLNSEDEKLLESTHGVLTELIDKSLANNDISIIKSIIVAGGDNDKLAQVQKLINDNNLIDKINTSKIEDNIKTSLVEKLNEIKGKEAPQETSEEKEQEPKPTLDEFLASIEDPQTRGFYEQLFKIHDYESFGENTDIPNYFQTVYSDKFASGTIRSAGCGITSLAMVSSYLTGEKITPDMLTNNYTGDNPASALVAGIKNLGLNAEYINGWGNCLDNLDAALEAGRPVIANFREPSLFTDAGHFVVIAGKTEDGKYIVNDPNIENYYNQSMVDGFTNGFTREQISQGLNHMYIFDAKEGGKTSGQETNKPTTSSTPTVRTDSTTPTVRTETPAVRTEAPAVRTTSTNDSQTHLQIRGGNNTTQPSDDDMIAVAHRGFSSEAPENTLASIQIAKENGYSAVELDISWTKDGVPVLLHDDTINRTSNCNQSLKCSDLNYSQLLQYDFGIKFGEEFAGTKIPTFREALECCNDNDMQFFAELKDTDDFDYNKAEQLVEQVISSGMQDKITWISFDSNALELINTAMSNANLPAKLGYLSRDKVTDKTIDILKDLQTGNNEVFLDIKASQLNEAGVKKLNEAGFEYGVWTVNDASQLDRLDDLGVSAVTTDKLTQDKLDEYNDEDITPVAVKPTTTTIDIRNPNNNLFINNLDIDVNYINDGKSMPYALIAPKNVDPNAQLPVLVYLHGGGSCNGSGEYFTSRGIVKALSETELANFNGYIIAPHLASGYEDTWIGDKAEANLRQLLNDFTSTHNVDRNNIALAGNSLGGQGTIYMAGKMGDVFSRAAVLSGYGQTAVDPSTIKIPIRGYVGTTSKGEDPDSIYYMQKNFGAKIGEENITQIEASHNGLTNAVFNLDTDGNGVADVLEWLFT
ncbi:MAG: hypothetical protein E7Z90_00005, partial [Cyanobacteria bacterium SIG29]|nr:hypothetical protein [Cyanobacteria bacterium SIG29]